MDWNVETFRELEKETSEYYNFFQDPIIPKDF